MGLIAPGGETDSWTFSANVGERIVIRVGEITQTNNFTPRIRLMTPTGTQQATDSGTLVAEVSVVATNTGTFTAMIDGVVANATGAYRVTLAKVPGTITVAPGDEGGPLTNGAMHTGTVSTGDLDIWTFTAANGDNLIARIGEITDTNQFFPGMRLYGPDGALLRSTVNSGGLAVEVSVRATNSGTFILVVGDNNGGLFGSGDYRLTLARPGNPVVVSSGDNGGAMTNGAMHTGTVLTGDLDLWTFTAASGDNVVLRIGMITDTNLFFPGIRLYGPDGALLDSGSGDLATEVSVRATNSGTFVAIVGDNNGGVHGSGDYRLTLAKTRDPVVVSPGDNGGPLTNGAMHHGTISTGDLDLWTFTANNGDNLVVRMGQITDTNTFLTSVRLYGPDGVLLRSSVDDLAVEVSIRATNSGTFIVVVGDGNGGLFGSGDYRLTLVTTRDPVTVSAGDDGGPLANGLTQTGTILTGDLDLWTFTANNGDMLIVRLGQVTDTNTFWPSMRLFGPDGVLLRSSVGELATEFSMRATNSGIFLVVVGDGNGGLFGSGDYRLTLARPGNSFETAAGDEGGLLHTGVNPEGVITVGDLDAYAFTRCKGEIVNLRIDELIDNGSFFPGLRLYGPDGVLVASASGATNASISLTTTNAGAFTVIVADNNGGLFGAGSYRLTGNGLSYELRLCVPRISGANVSLGGVGGVTGTEFVVLTSPLVEAPLAAWTPLFTNQFDFFGTFTRSNAYPLNEPRRFFILRLQ